MKHIELKIPKMVKIPYWLNRSIIRSIGVFIFVVFIGWIGGVNLFSRSVETAFVYGIAGVFALITYDLFG